MTDHTIPMIIGMTLAFMLGAGFGALWGLGRHEWLYCRVTAHLTGTDNNTDTNSGGNNGGSEQGDGDLEG